MLPSFIPAVIKLLSNTLTTASLSEQSVQDFIQLLRNHSRPSFFFQGCLRRRAKESVGKMKSIDCACGSWETAVKQQSGDKPGNHSPGGVIIELKTNDGIGVKEWVICCFPSGIRGDTLTWCRRKFRQASNTGGWPT